MHLRSSLIAGAIAGLLAGLAFAALHALIIVPIWDRMLMGLAFGAGAGITDAIAVLLAVSGGVAVAWLRARRVRSAVAMSLAALCLTLAMGGPVPVARSVRAAEIYLAVLVASLFAGVVLGALEPRLRRPSASIFGAGDRK